MGSAVYHLKQRRKLWTLVFRVVCPGRQVGIDVLVLDFDTYFMQNPTARVLQQVQEKDVEVLMGYSFVADCICNAFLHAP